MRPPQHSATPDTPPPPDWTADQRFGDDRPVGSLADLEALCARRLGEIVGPDDQALDGQVFRYERDLVRYSDLTGIVDDEVPWHDAGNTALDAVERVLGGRYEDANDPATEALFWTERDAAKAARAHPWDLREIEGSLDDLLAEGDDADPEWLIEHVWPHGGKVVLAAPAKAGKSTLVGNALRSLADGAPLFGPPVDGLIGATTWQAGYAVSPLREGETIYLADLELTRGQVRRWLRDQAIERTDRIRFELYRGRVGDLDVRDPTVRAELAARLRAQRTRVIVVDPVGAALSAAGIDENRNGDVRRFLQALDALALEAGATELLVVHHMGHQGERSRGGTAFRDWPDAEWRLLRPQGDADAPRFFSAAGRDVAVPETALRYDGATRRLSLVTGDRHTVTADQHTAAVVAAVRAAPGVATRNLEAAVKASAHLSTATVRRAIASAKEAGEIHHHDGPNKARAHFLGRDTGACPCLESSAAA